MQVSRDGNLCGGCIAFCQIMQLAIGDMSSAFVRIIRMEGNSEECIPFRREDDTSAYSGCTCSVEVCATGIEVIFSIGCFRTEDSEPVIIDGWHLVRVLE